MRTLNDESLIIECFQSVESEEVLFDNESKENINIFQSIHLQDNWEKWTDSSGKASPPPDFYCDEFKLMMEVMRVDDHAYINEKGKIINPTLARENKKKKLLEKIEIPNDTNVFFNVDTGLPTFEDHNYYFYYENFKRVVEKHNKSVENYRKNHPNCKLIFFVCDESSQYIESLDKNVCPQNTYDGQAICGNPHIFFADKMFLDVVKKCEADYLMWFADNKLIQSLDGIVFPPKVVVYEIKKIKMDEIVYIEKNMISTEV